MDVKGRNVNLRPRSRTKNEDEERRRQPEHLRGKTNYFIFPSQDGEDAGWLQGKTFQSIVILRCTRGSETFVSEEFVLKPHVH